MEPDKIREAERYHELVNAQEFKPYKELANHLFSLFTEDRSYALPTAVEFFLTHQGVTIMALESILIEQNKLKKRIQKLEEEYGV